MKNTLSLIGAIVIGIGVMVASALIVKKYLDKKALKKKEAAAKEEDCCCGCCDEEEDLNWEDIPVEDDDETIIADVKELDGLDADK